MKRLALICLTILIVSGADAGVRPKHARKHPAKPPAPVFDPAAVNDASQIPVVGLGAAGSAVLRAQILLDRAKFSPGEIGGRFNPNTVKAVRAFQSARNLNVTGQVDAETWAILNQDSAPAITGYRIVAEDVAGPFEKIPPKMEQQATLPALAYSSSLEELAERCHSSPKLLTALNPGKAFDKPEEDVLVPNVLTPPPPRAASVVVSASDPSVTVLDGEGRVIAYYPASVGSQHDPLPIGNAKILGRKRNPKFHYNPKLFWDAHPKDTKETIQPGPNNPVGLVWIELSVPHYGIHGTPEPSRIGRTQSHGCIRLTNWDALELADIVQPGTRAVLEK